jgi:hypothetical protein
VSFTDDDRRTIGAALQIALMAVEAERAALLKDPAPSNLKRRERANNLAEKFKGLIEKIAQSGNAAELFRQWNEPPA